MIDVDIYLTEHSQIRKEEEKKITIEVLYVTSVKLDCQSNVNHRK